VVSATGKLHIRKSVAATNAAMNAATGADLIFNVASTYNVTSPSYNVFTGAFLGVAETKFIGFQLYQAGSGTAEMYIDDIIIREFDYPPCAYYCPQGGTASGTRYITTVEFNTISRASVFDGYVCTGLSTTLQRTLNYDLTVITAPSASTYYSAAWIDWNGDGDFIDAGENVMASAIHGGTTRVQTITVPAAAKLGVTKMRVKTKFDTAIAGPCEAPLTNDDVEDYDIDIAPAPTPMVYVSSTVTQNNTTAVNAGSFRNEVIGVQVVTSGTLSPISATSFTFNTTGTTNAAVDIQNAQLWYTSNNNAFATGTQVGALVANPNGTFTITGSVQLIQGVNYFWLSYDIPPGATSPDVIDAQCTSVTVAGTPQTPTITSPEGNRPIITATPMLYVSSTTTQNVSRTPRPDANHLIVGIEIVTTGAASPLAVTSFSFNTTGTTTPATNILNARLWSTGTNSSFATATQIGATVAAPNGAFTITPTVNLNNGTNYFWLTYDIPATAACDPAQADAQCSSITVAGVPLTPTVTSPLGAVVIDCNTAYYSKGNLPPNIVSSWNTRRDGTGADATAFGVTSMFYVQSGHTMNTTAAVTIPYMTVEAGGYVKGSHLITMNDLRINSFGTYEQIVQAADGAYITNFYIENFGTWIHNNAGFLPNGNRYFSPRSNQWFYQWGGGTFPNGTAWGSVLLNGITVGNFLMGNVLTTIQGDFEWRRIGNNNYLLDQVNETINIGGNLIFSGGWWKVAYDNSTPGNQTRLVTINVAGDFIMTSGTLEDYARGNASSATTLNVLGNVNITGGTFNMNLSPGGSSVMNLTPGSPTSTWTQTGGTVTLGNTFVKAGKRINMLGARIGNVAVSRTFTVETNAKLYCSNFPVLGAGNFTLQTGGWLGIGSAAGITSSGATGNIQVTGIRSYNSGATLEYYEGLTPQITGNFTTTTTSAAYPVQIANLIINKAAPTNIVTLTNTTDVNSVLTLTGGVLTTSYFANTAPWIRIPSVASVSPVGGSQNSYVDGYIRRQGATAFIFPTGNSGKWRRIAVTAPSISTEFEARYVGAPYVNSTTMAAASSLVLDHVSKLEHWFLTKPVNPADGATTRVQLFWEDALLSGIYKFDSLAVGRWSGTVWENSNCVAGCPANWTSSTIQRTYTGVATGNGAGTIESNTVSAYGPFTFSSIGIIANNPLPVSLLSFESACRVNDVLVKWTTASETNNDYFSLLKSADGRNFNEIARIKGAGSTSNLKSYEYSDSEQFNRAYYKLTQTDFDGTSEELKITAVNCSVSKEQFMNALFNPEGYIQVKFINTLENAVFIELSDATGRVLYHGKQGTEVAGGVIRIDAAKLNPGVYFVNAWDGVKRYTVKVAVN
jgi:hypothetical protein